MASKRDWTTYWRDPTRPVEAMRAHYEEHAFSTHSHDAYSFAVTEAGLQSFRCRGAEHTSAAGMVIAFNPDDPHDGHAGAELGFTYRIVHIGPEVVREVLADATGGAAAMPLFTEPVHHDPVLRGAVSRLHEALAGGADPLVRDERLTAAVTAMVRRHATAPLRPGATGPQRELARRARALLAEDYACQLTGEQLATAVGCSRFALYRAFRAEYGMAPSDYQRLLRLRAARRGLMAGASAAEAATAAGFADQSHFHRWFVRSYGITPGAFQLAASS